MSVLYPPYTGSLFVPGFNSRCWYWPWKSYTTCGQYPLSSINFYRDVLNPYNSSSSRWKLFCYIWDSLSDLHRPSFVLKNCFNVFMVGHLWGLELGGKAAWKCLKQTNNLGQHVSFNGQFVTLKRSTSRPSRLGIASLYFNIRSNIIGQWSRTKIYFKPISF